MKFWKKIILQTFFVGCLIGLLASCISPKNARGLQALRPSSEKISALPDSSQAVGLVFDVIPSKNWIVVEQLFDFSPVQGRELLIRDRALEVICRGKILEGWTRHFLILYVESTDGVSVGLEVVAPSIENDFEDETEREKS